MKHKKGSYVKVIIGMVILGAAIIGGFFVVSNRADKEKKEVAVDLTTAEKLIQKPIMSEYPPTPREVVKLYSTLLQCIYTDEVSEEQMNQLCNQAYLLYDQELTEVNPEDIVQSDLQKEVEFYRSSGQQIFSFRVESGDDIITWSDQNREYAKVSAIYTIKQEANLKKTPEDFILRKDDAGHWKIVGWRLSEDSDV